MNYGFSGGLSPKKIDKIVNAWKDGKEKHYSGYNIFTDGKAIYSYGSHFPMVVRNPSGLIIGNGDRRSSTTTCHQNAVRHLVEVLIPFTALSTLGVSPFDDEIKLVEKQDDFYKTVKCMRKDSKTGKMKECEYEQHFLGGSLIRVTQESYVRDGAGNHVGNTINIRSFICGWDSTGKGWAGAFFVSELPGHPTSVGSAIEMLKPEEVRTWEARHGKEALRQGEWFFIPLDPIYSPDGEVNKSSILQGRNRGTGHHKALRRIVTAVGNQFVCGMVRHLNGDHRVVKLGKQWHEAIENTAMASAGVGRKVD